MSVALSSNSPIEAAFNERTPGSARRAESARGVFPSGLVHDARRMLPYPIYVEKGLGPRKWDVDGNEYIDYYGGHGALILGHAHPAMLAATQAQLALGTHYGACHDLEVRWGETVQTMVPCAERVRFTSSGTEANLLALRLARAHTGKSKIVRFRGHFHGWQDHVAFGVDSHFDGTASAGVLAEIASNVILADADDAEGTAALLRGRDDIAVLILEPTGGSFSALPLREQMLTQLREITAERGIVLLFDEVVTGFRVSPAGAQGHYGVTPDVATFAKIVAGGLPGGCVAGRKDLLDHLDFDICKAQGIEKVGHQGTYNANPVCAAAGIAALTEIASTDACEHATSQAARLRAGANDVFAAHGVPWACYGTHSAFYFYLNPEGDALDPLGFDPYRWSRESIKAGAGLSAAHKLRLALMVEGVDISGKPGGLVSAAHGDAEIDATLVAFDNAVVRLKDEGEV